MSRPVMRLSQALYSDAPSPTPARMTPPSSSASRKRCHSRVAGPPFGRRSTRGTDASAAAPAAAAATVVRVLLPRTFATADRAYHAAGDATPAGAAREEEGKVAGCALCRGVRAADGMHTTTGVAQDDDAVGVSCDDSAADGEVSTVVDCSNGNSNNNNGNSRSTPCSAASSAARNEGGSQRRCYGRSPAVAGGDAAPAVATTLVVESVLGFSAVRALLERSHGHAAAGLGGVDEPAGNPPSCAAGADITGADITVIGKNPGACGDGGVVELGVSQALGRLVGWLRLAAASESLMQQEQQRRSGSGSGSGSGGKLTDLVGKEPARGDGDGEGGSLPSRAREKAVLGEDDGAMAAPAVSAGAIVAEAGTGCVGYEVTGRCEAGSEWSVFDLERTQGTAGQRSSLSRLSAHSMILEVKLICHPLITMVPDIRWCLRLISQAKAVASLLNANAKLSTLGGGYFLTRQVGQAIRLARAQTEVAAALGDMRLAGKCRVNEAYNFIWLGQYAVAQRIIEAQVAASRAAHDEDLENVAAIAGRFLRRSRKANRRLLVSHAAARNDQGSNGGGREWTRQRIDVKTDEWHRVRALPLYCSSGRDTPVGWEAETTPRGQQRL